MATPQTAKQAITIRNIDATQEMHQVEALQREVWGPGDVVPLTHLVATKEAGGILIGAFEKEQLVGFVYGFIGRDQGHLMIHSHMMAIKPAYRDLGLGYKLKLAQRERARELNFKRMTWTFDPLQSRNAHLNFGKLGVIANRYEKDFYGQEDSSPLDSHIGTDRLWVTWLLDSGRVVSRLRGRAKTEVSWSKLSKAKRLVQLGDDISPHCGELDKGATQPYALIEIPYNIASLQQERPETAKAWREATRSAFVTALNLGYFVKEFYCQNMHNKQIGVYLLSSEKSEEPN